MNQLLFILYGLKVLELLSSKFRNFYSHVEAVYMQPRNVFLYSDVVKVLSVVFF